MLRFVERVLNLQRGDLGRGGLLFAYLFLIMGSYLVARVARDALFLDQFQAVALPYVDLAIFGLIGFVVSGYLLLSRRVALRTLLVASLVFFASNTFAFWYFAHYYRFRWLIPVVYVWVGMFGVVAPAQVWTLANYVMTTREAKRVFAVVSSGAISGAIFGGKFANLMAPRYGTESLLMAMTLALAGCAVLVMLIWRQKQRLAPGPEEPATPPPDEKPPNLRDSLRLIGSVPYLRALAGLILVANIVTSLAGWQFKALAKHFYAQKDALAAFFGDFYFYAGLAGLAVQLLLTNRLLRRFGLGTALFVVPVAMLVSSGGVLLWGMATIWAAIALRSSINVFQYSIDRPTVEVLYLPVPAEIKNQVKSFVDTVVWRSGDGLAAIATLIFATTLGWSAVRLSWVNLIFILGWMAAAWMSRRQYVETLRESIHQHRLDAERASAAVLDRATTDLVADRLAATDPREILYGLSLLEIGRRQAAHPAVRGLLEHPAPEVRQKALAILNAAGDRSVLPTVEGLLRDPVLGVRTEALLFLSRHAHVDPVTRLEELGDFADFSIRAAMVAYLAHPGPAQNLVAAEVLLEKMVGEAGGEGARARIEAARLLPALPDQFPQHLRRLLTDPEPGVAAEAIRSVGRLRKRRFVFLVLDRIAEPALTPAAVEALAELGDAIVGALRDHLADPGVPLEPRREIPAVLARIGSPEAARVLNETLLEADTQLRFRTIQALNKLYQAHPEIERDTRMIETVLATEIMGHYRSYQVLGTLGDTLSETDPIARALRESMNQEIERIFRLLALLYPRFDLHSAYFGVQSANPVVHDNALEFLDNVLQPQLRSVLLPLLDSSVSVAERVRRAGQVVGAEVTSREEAVAVLLRSEDPWLKACGAYAAGTLGIRQLEPDLDRCLEHPDALLRETARQAKLRLAHHPAAS